MAKYLDTEGQIIYLTPINTSEDMKKVSYSQLVALYQEDTDSVINVGRPALCSYLPAMANMYGHKAANIKKYYLAIPESELTEYCEVPVFRVILTDSNTINVEQTRCLNEDDLSIVDTLIPKNSIQVVKKLAK